MSDWRENLGAQRLQGERTRHTHRWSVWTQTGMACKCGVPQDLDRSRLGMSSRRLGGDQERRIEKVYGPRKVGQFGDAIDLIGRDFLWQSKASRAAPPVWLSGVSPEAQRAHIPSGWLTCFTAIDRLRKGKPPLLIRSYVRSGVPTKDWIVVRSADWSDLHGGDWLTPYTVMTGHHFLRVHGRDE